MSGVTSGATGAPRGGGYLADTGVPEWFLFVDISKVLYVKMPMPRVFKKRYLKFVENGEWGKRRNTRLDWNILEFKSVIYGVNLCSLI